MKNFLFTLLPIFGLLLLAGCEKEAATPSTRDTDSTIDFRSDKVTVCHYTGSETNTYEIIEVADQSWVKAHMEHGDAVDMDGDGYFDRENGCGEIVDCDDNDPNVYETCALPVTVNTGSETYILYVHPEDQRTGTPESNDVRWGEVVWDIPVDDSKCDDLPNFSYINYGIGAKAAALTDYNGSSNTATIVCDLGEGDYAAKVCDELVAFGHDDWYLPALGELKVIYDQLGGIGNNNFKGLGYWSSTEFNKDYAWVQIFDPSHPEDQTFVAKNNDFQSPSCRCVRRD